MNTVTPTNTDKSTNEGAATEGTSLEFSFNWPFRTKCGWPARLVGTLQRTAFPFVVAIMNPAFGAEEMHCYNKGGEQPVDVKGHDEVVTKGVVDGPLSLVNVSDDEFFAVKDFTPVTASVMEMKSYPPNCNPFHHDMFHMGTNLVRGWMVMHEGFVPDGSQFPLRYVEMVNFITGQRFKVSFAPKET
jgi:hypothetical protein